MNEFVSAMQPTPDGNPKTNPLGTASEEAVKLFRLIIAARSIARLLLIQSGRVVATCVAPPSPLPKVPNPAERVQWTADELASLVPELARNSIKFDQLLQDFESQASAAREQAIARKLK